MNPDQLIKLAAKEAAGGIIRGSDDALVVERHDPVKALLDHTGHQAVELLQLSALVQGNVEIVIGLAAGQHGGVALQQRLAARTLLGRTPHGAADIASSFAIMLGLSMIQMIKTLRKERCEVCQ